MEGRGLSCSLRRPSWWRRVLRRASVRTTASHTLSPTRTCSLAHTHAHTHTSTHCVNISPGPAAALDPSAMSPPRSPGKLVTAPLPCCHDFLGVYTVFFLTVVKRTHPQAPARLLSWALRPGSFELCLPALPQPEGDPSAEPAHPAHGSRPQEPARQQRAE